MTRKKIYDKISTDINKRTDTWKHDWNGTWYTTGLIQEYMAGLVQGFMRAMGQWYMWGLVHGYLTRIIKWWYNDKLQEL